MNENCGECKYVHGFFASKWFQLTLRYLFSHTANGTPRTHLLPPPLPMLSDTYNENPSVVVSRSSSGGNRLNKFVRRLHAMLQAEKNSGVVEWRRGLLVLHSTEEFATKLLPKYFSTRNFKTFRRQLNYYGFVHVRSFSTTGSVTTALWVNRDLAETGTDDISSVLKLKRVELCETAKTAEGRRQRKEQAIVTVEEDIGVCTKALQLEQIQAWVMRESPQIDNRRHQVLDSPQLPARVEGDYSDSGCDVNEEGTGQVDDAPNTSESDDGSSATAAIVLLMLSKA